MILLAAAYLAGDVWTWDVDLRYADRTGVLLDDRERWTMRIGKGGAVEAERAFVGTVVEDGTLVPTSDPRPEILKGGLQADGTFDLKGKWSDPAAFRLFRTLLHGDDSLGERVVDWPVLRRAVVEERAAWIPGGNEKADLRVTATLASARLGGKTITIPSKDAKG